MAACHLFLVLFAIAVLPASAAQRTIACFCQNSVPGGECVPQGNAKETISDDLTPARRAELITLFCWPYCQIGVRIYGIDDPTNIRLLAEVDAACKTGTPLAEALEIVARQENPPAPVEQKAPSTIVPRLQIPIPTVKFTDIKRTRDGEVETLDIPWLADYIDGVYRYAVGIAGALAAVIMMIGGFQYVTAGGDKSRVDAGKEKIKNATIGLALSVGAYVLLNAINPDLVGFNALKIVSIKRIEYENLEMDEETRRLRDVKCNGLNDSVKIEDCKENGSDPVDISTIIKQSNSDASPILDRTAASKLDAALKDAYAKDVPTRTFNQAFRTFEMQDCLHKKLGKIAAAPGNSKHERGLAIDIGTGGLTDETYKQLVNSMARQGWNVHRNINAAKISDGSWEDTEERWHFEFNGQGVTCKKAGTAEEGQSMETAGEGQSMEADASPAP